MFKPLNDQSVGCLVVGLLIIIFAVVLINSLRIGSIEDAIKAPKVNHERPN